MVSSPKYRKWMVEAGTKISAWCLANDWKILEPSYEEQYEFDVEIFQKEKLADFTNYVKAIKDVLSGGIYTDDRWVGMHIQMPVQLVSSPGVVIIDLNYRIYRHGGR
jgi:protein involved in sex pheromone biosynthesis